MTVSTDLQPHYQVDGYEAFTALAFEKQWSDGLPLVPPTPHVITQFLDSVDLAPDTVIGTVPSRDIEITAEVVAANAVMAGCSVEHMPTVLAAARAHLSPLGNSHCVTATIMGAAQIVILNGPIRTRLGVISGDGAFGPGSRANATIGRALRLIVRNGVGSVPGGADRAGYSNPGRYSFCFGEDEERSSWTPLHVERGFAPDEDVVTVASVTDCYAMFERDGGDPESFLRRLSRLARCRPILPDGYLGENRFVLLVIGQHHRALLERAGWSKADVRAFVYPLLAAPHTHGAGVSCDHGMHPAGDSAACSLDGVEKADNVLIVAAGGDEPPLSWVIYSHMAAAISTPIVSRYEPNVKLVPAY